MLLQVHVKSIDEVPAARGQAEALAQEGDTIEIIVAQNATPLPPALQERKQAVGDR